jgi:hypothetical protein
MLEGYSTRYALDKVLGQCPKGRWGNAKVSHPTRDHVTPPSFEFPHTQTRETYTQSGKV